MTKYNVFLVFSHDFKSRIYFQQRETSKIVKNAKKRQKTQFSVYHRKSAKKVEIFKIVVLRVAARFLIQIFFVGLTNISTCRKHDFSTGGRFFLLPTEAFSPGHFSASPLKTAEVILFRQSFFGVCKNL